MRGLIYISFVTFVVFGAIAIWQHRAQETVEVISLNDLQVSASMTAKIADKVNPKLWVNPDSYKQATGNKKVIKGLLTFRGNATRTYHGKGPIPRSPKVEWKYPDKPMCASSYFKGKMEQWCGTGWTGQPSVFEYAEKTWVVFGAYDRGVHFVNADNGKAIRETFYTGDIIKGSVTIDPDGFPIVYSGSRDGFYRAIAFDKTRPRELWKLSAEAVGPAVWNDDWDGSGLVIDDHLFIGGENSRIHVVRLNRHWTDSGVGLAPKILDHAPGWDRSLMAAVGDRNVSIENSVAIFENTLYFANSGGLIQGWDIQKLARGKSMQKKFSWWAGDDIDASIVIDHEGSLYVGVERERFNSRSKKVGQMLKLAPGQKNPLVWSHGLPGKDVDGVWGTPALYKDTVMFPTNSGDLYSLDRTTGKQKWKLQFGSKTWSSPVVVAGTLLQGDCDGNLHAFDLKKPTPVKKWTLKLDGCIESTPAVWGGKIYVGTRSGYMYAIGESSISK